MNTYRLIREANPTFEDAEFLEEQLYHYNVEQTGYDDGRILTIWIHNDPNERLAGLHGWTWGGSCYIRDLWVHPDLRGQGYGTQLLQAAEQEARTRGCHHVVLESYSFHRLLAFTNNTATRCSRCLRTIPVDIASITCGNA